MTDPEFDPATARNWRGTVNGLLYSVQFDPELNDAVIDRLTGLILSRRALSRGAAEYLWAIDQALAQDDPLNDAIETPNSDAEFRAFLARLSARLEAERPWPAVEARRNPLAPKI
jgi:hypothetical protein